MKSTFRDVVLPFAVGLLASLFASLPEMRPVVLLIVTTVLLYYWSRFLSLHKISLKLALAVITTDTTMQKQINSFAERHNAFSDTPRHYTVRGLWKIIYFTLVGSLSWCYVVMGLLVSASYGTGINERSLEECLLGGLGSFIIAVAIFYLFNKWIN